MLTLAPAERPVLSRQARTETKPQRGDLTISILSPFHLLLNHNHLCLHTIPRIVYQIEIVQSTACPG